MGKVRIPTWVECLSKMVFIGHFAHWSRKELLALTEEELDESYKMCIEIHNELNTQEEDE